MGGCPGPSYGCLHCIVHNVQIKPELLYPLTPSHELVYDKLRVLTSNTREYVRTQTKTE